MAYGASFGPSSPEDLAVGVTNAQLPLDSYSNREGYDEGFLDDGPDLPLPGSGRWDADLVPVTKGNGAGGSELKYTHFSVVMSVSRALPLFSACNISGKFSDRNVKRTDTWRTDPRIDVKYQDLRTSYGNEGNGLFSRGHMTRREDPNWGSAKLAKQADADTFHIANVAPQRQGFNAGIWLDLENYVLDNTDENDLKVTVITGPVLHREDPTYFGIKVPVEFWKILAFVNYRTKRLTTIGYKRSQLSYLPSLATANQFVFGDFDDTQVSVASLMDATGLDLSAFVAHDVMNGAGATLGVRLEAVSDAYLRP